MENESYSGAKNTYKLSSTATHLTVTVGDLEPPRPSMRDQEQTTLRDKPGCFQLWASFPTSSKLFLFFSVAFAAGGTIFAIVQFRQAGDEHLQDVLLVLFSSLFFLFLSVHAFYRKNAYDILVCVALALLNCVQLVVFGATMGSGSDSVMVGFVTVCVLLLVATIALGRFAFRGFGWHMYSRLGRDARLKDAEMCRQALSRMDLFSSLLKLDAQLLLLLFLVSLANGVNPSGPHPLPLLITAAAVLLPLEAVWLLAANLAVRRQRQRLAMGVEFVAPLGHILPLLIMFGGISSHAALSQSHGVAYLVLYPLLLMLAHTAVWWDLRLLSRDFLSLRKAQAQLRAPLHSSDSLAGAAAAAAADLPPELTPLVQGAWLRKLPSPGTGCAPHLDAATVGCGGSGGAGKWRYFQLSHDGSTLRWSWDKFVLLLHVDDIICSDDDLTITLVLLLDPDLRLRFPDRQLYQDWQRGLRTLLRMLLDPGGLPPGSSGSLGSRHEVVVQLREGSTSSGSGNSSPAKLLRRLRGRPGRACQVELTRGQLRSAAQHARSMLSRQKPPQADPQGSGSDEGGASQAGGSSSSSGEGEEPRERQELAGGRSRRPRTSHSDPSELPCRSASAHWPTAKRPKSKRLDWVRRALTNPSNFMRSDSTLATSRGSPSKQRLTEHAEQVSDYEGFFTRDASGSLHSQPSGGAEGTGRSAAIRRYRSLSVDMGAAGSGGVPQDGAVWHAHFGGGSPPSSHPRGNPFQRGSGSGGEGGGHGSVHSRGSSAAPPSLPSLRGFTQPGSHALSPAPQAQQLAPGAALPPSLHPPGTHATSAPYAQYEQHAHDPSQRSTVAGTTFEASLPWEQAHREGAQGVDRQGVQGQGIPEDAVFHQRGVSISLSGVPGIPGGGRLTEAEEGPAAAAAALDQPLHLRSGSAGSGFAFLPDASAWQLPHRPVPQPPSPPPSVQQAQQGSSPRAPQWAHPAAPPASPVSDSGAQPQRQALQDEVAARGGETVGGATVGRDLSLADEVPARGGSLLHGGIQALGGCHPIRTEAGGGEGQPREAGAAFPDGAPPSLALPFPSRTASPTPGWPALAGRGTSSPLRGGGPYPQRPESAFGEMLRQWSGLSGALVRGESDTYSSWGMPTPSSARTVATGGLSRMNSLPGGAQQAQQQATPAAAAHALAGLGYGAPPGLPPLAGLLPPGGPTSGTSSVEGGWTAGTSPTHTPHSPHGRGVNVPVELIRYEDLLFGRLLGEGSEGPVHAAWYMETPVAVKRTRSLQEAEMCLHAGCHDNIVGLRGLCQHGSHVYLVMELCPRGTLDVLVHHTSSHKLEPMKLLPIVRSVARGMLHLHTRKPPILHRDLKPGNLFIGHGYVVKVGDLGMSRYAAQGGGGGPAHEGLERTLTPGVIGTAAYCAPEVLNPESPMSQGASRSPDLLLKADVYSFGVTLWEIIERKRPYRDMDGFQIQTQWFLEPESMRLPPLTMPDTLTPQGRSIMQTLANLVQLCTEWDPARRPSFREVLTMLRVASGAESTPPTPASATTCCAGGARP